MVATDVDLPSRMDAVLGPDGNGWLVHDLNAGSEIQVFRLSAGSLLGIKLTPPKPRPRHHKPRRHHKPAKHHRHHKPKR